ncbi:hypothetical protein MAR_037550, partial [Mya arenaria]
MEDATNVCDAKGIDTMEDATNVCDAKGIDTMATNVCDAKGIDTMEHVTLKDANSVVANITQYDDTPGDVSCNAIDGTYALPGNRPLSANELMNIIVKDIPALPKVPCGRRKMCMLCWIIQLMQNADRQINQRSTETTAVYYLSLKRRTDYKKRVTWIEGRNIGREIAANTMKMSLHTATPKLQQMPMKKTAPDVMKKLQDKVEHQKPRDVYAQMTDPCHNNSLDFPRDIRQCQHVKALQKAEKRKGMSNNNIADDEQHPFVAEVIHSRKNPLPSVICSTNDQVTDFKSFICSNESVIGVDRTFSL